jgi:hypothetical protein
VYLFREFVSISEPATAVSSNNNAVKEKKGVGVCEDEEEAELCASPRVRSSTSSSMLAKSEIEKHVRFNSTENVPVKCVVPMLRTLMLLFEKVPVKCVVRKMLRTLMLLFEKVPADEHFYENICS